MDRINGANWTDIGGGKRGFRNQNKLAGIAGTVLAALWLNGMQEEIAYVIEQSGQALSDADNTLLYKAMRIFARAGMYALDTGAVNAMEVTAIGAIGEGGMLLVKVGNTNTIAGVTLKVNAGAAQPVYFEDGTALTVGALQGGSYALLTYTGTAWRLVNGTAWATAAEAADRTVERRAVDPKRLHASITDLLGYENLLFNPLFRINQDGFAGGAVSAGTYAIDMWGAPTGTAANLTFANGVATIAVGKMRQIVENPGVALGNITLHWEGTAQAQINGGAAASSPIVYNHAAAANITIDFGVGTVSRPMLAVGNKPIPFRVPSPAVDRLNCYRTYYVNTDALDHYVPTALNSSGSWVVRYYLAFPTAMRAVPAITITAYNLYDRGMGTPSPRPDLSGFTMRVDVAAGNGYAGIANVRFKADARIAL